ncbi:MAG: translation elongation factor EF-1 subunit alpha [Candidatus Iainarchaeum sp.]|jgi:elongation factor 1-alpha
MAEKELINVVFIGHVDAGKSTSVGRLLYDGGALTEQEYRKLEEEAKSKGKGTFVFAYVMDNLKEERERGVTIDVSYKKLEAKNHRFTIIDAPGHRDFVKNMITGTSQADVAVLVVSAESGVQPQTKEHAFLAQVMGIKQMVVALNKMDAINYDEAKFKEVSAEVTKLLTTTGYKAENLKIVPISSWRGDNVVKKTDNLKWYTGKTLLETLDDLQAPPSPIDKPLRIPLQDVYNIKGVGAIPVGRVETGTAKPGDKVIVMPSGKQGEIKTMEEHHTQLSQAKPGNNIGFSIRGLSSDDMVRGDVVGSVTNPPTVAKSFTAQIVVLNHPTAIPVGYTPVFHVHTVQMSMSLIEIQKKIDPRSGAVVEENPKFLKTGDAAIVKIKPTKPVCIEKFSEFPQMGRFAIRDMGQTVAAGVVLDIEKA